MRILPGGLKIPALTAEGEPEQKAPATIQTKLPPRSLPLPSAKPVVTAALVDPKSTPLLPADLALRVPADALALHLAAYTRVASATELMTRGVSLERFYAGAAKGHFGAIHDQPITYAAFKSHMQSLGLASSGPAFGRAGDSSSLDRSSSDFERILGGLSRADRAKLFDGALSPSMIFTLAAKSRATWRALEAPIPFPVLARELAREGRSEELKRFLKELPPRTRQAVETSRVPAAEIARMMDDARLRKSDVLVIGAGMAGLAAANEMLDSGLTVTVLEARDRIGGRTYTEESSIGVAFDQGAAWLHGGDDNPLTAITEKLGFTTVVDDAPHRAYGGKSDPVTEGKAFVKALDATRDAWSELSGDAAISKAKPVDLPWAGAASSVMAAGSFGVEPKDVSSKDWNTIHPEIGDKLVKEGLGSVVASFAHGVPVKLGCAVSKVKWGEDGVEVTANGQRYLAKKLVITVPTGVLAAGKIEFDPPLPAWKTESFEKLPMARFDKVALSFEAGALPSMPKATHIAPLDDPNALVGELPMELVARPFDADVVIGLVGGDAAKRIETDGKQKLVDETVARLERIFGKSLEGALKSAFVTDWSADPWSEGAFSAAKPGFQHMRERLKKPVEDTLFWAGEAAHDEWAQCVPGAYLTGIEAAKDIEATLRDERLDLAKRKLAKAG